MEVVIELMLMVWLGDGPCRKTAVMDHRYPYIECSNFASSQKMIYIAFERGSEGYDSFKLCASCTAVGWPVTTLFSLFFAS